MLLACGYVARCRRTTVQCPNCTTFHFLWCLRIASFGAVTQLFFSLFLTRLIVVITAIITTLFIFYSFLKSIFFSAYLVIITIAFIIAFIITYFLFFFSFYTLRLPMGTHYPWENPWVPGLGMGRPWVPILSGYPKPMGTHG